MIRLTQLVQIGLSIVRFLQIVARTSKNKQQAAPNPTNMKILLEACVWPGPHSRCIVSVYTSTLCCFGCCRGPNPAGMDRNGQKLVELTMEGQQGVKGTQKAPKWRGKGQRGQAIAEMARQLPERHSKSPKQPENHQNSQATTKRPRKLHWTTLPIFARSENQLKKLVPKKLRKTVPDSVVTFFFSISGPFWLWGPPGALRS